ncbi:MAG: NAD(P)H-binding protein [Solirubrobacteraceae bacterium]|nr:NAD(P)H-binding protein [Solirubrobacteraceae bacterium]
MTIAISGASGNLGRRTAELLLEQVDPSSVVLLSRTPSKLDDLAAKGASVRAADFSDPAGVEAALAGVEKLLLVSTDTVGDRVEQQQAAIAAAKAAGVRHVIYTSAPQTSADSPSLVVREHHATEEALKASGLAYTFLRNNLYSEFQIAAGAGAVAGGAVYSNKAGRGVAYVTREDCAAAAAAVLAGGAEHENVVYEISGSEAITDEQLAALFAEVTGQPAGFVEVDDAALTAGMIAGGVPEFMAPILVGFGEAARLGALELVTTAVADLTGKAPTPLAEVLEGAKDELLAPAPATH